MAIMQLDKESNIRESKKFSSNWNLKKWEYFG